MQLGNSTFSSRISSLILAGYQNSYGALPELGIPARLSPRERQVVLLVCEGKTSKEIAMLMGVGLKRAETHRSNVMMKLNLHSVVDLVMYAIRNGSFRCKLRLLS